MSKGNVFENDLLKLIFNGTSIDYIANNNTISPLTHLYVSLHTSDPGESGNQTTNETDYGDYERIAVSRDSSGWTITDNEVNPTSEIIFPESTNTSSTLTHFAIGTDYSGSGKILYKGELNPAVDIVAGITPRLTTSTSVTEE